MLDATDGRIQDRLKRTRLAHLRETWRYARENSIYYAGILPNIEDDELDFRHLLEVPTCSKNDLARFREEIRCKRGVPDFVVFTGGTTGTPQIIYHAKEDLDHHLSANPRIGNHPLGLITGGGHQGDRPLIPGNNGLLRLPLRNRKNFSWAKQLLEMEHHFEGFEPKISYALLPTNFVKKLSLFLLEQDCNRSNLSVNFIGTAAEYLSTPWRKFIQEYFNATVVDHFGFAEIGHLARECAMCGWYHYGEEVIWEVVNHWTGAPLHEGIGKLLVTSLFPFVRDHILFRYEPGDLVEIGPFCGYIGECGFRPRGRISQSFATPVGARYPRWLLLPLDVQEVVDFHPLVARSEAKWIQDITGWDDDAFPKWCVKPSYEEGVTTLTVQVEMKSSIYLFSDQWRSFRDDLRMKLLASNQDLKDQVEQNKVLLCVEGLPPGSLDESDICIC